MECQKSKVVELLKGASQQSVTLNSIEVPITSLKLDIHQLTHILKELEKDNVIIDYSGFWSYTDSMVFPTFCTLTESFFQANRKQKIRKGQLNLFEK